jgi:hypothetical protein
MRRKGHGGKADDQDQKPKRQGHVLEHAGTLPYSAAKSKPLFGPRHDESRRRPRSSPQRSD